MRKCEQIRGRRLAAHIKQAAATILWAVTGPRQTWACSIIGNTCCAMLIRFDGAMGFLQAALRTLEQGMIGRFWPRNAAGERPRASAQGDAGPADGIAGELPSARLSGNRPDFLSP